jgi:hypothetical protein
MAREPKEREGPIGVRLPAAVKTSLEDAADANHRSLHGEIVARLAKSLRPVASRRDAFAWLLGELDARLAVAGAPIAQEDAQTLAVLKHAITGLLDQFGATEANLTEDQILVASAVGRQLARDFMTVANWAEAQPGDRSITGAVQALRTHRDQSGGQE